MSLQVGEQSVKPHFIAQERLLDSIDRLWKRLLQTRQDAQTDIDLAKLALKNLKLWQLHWLNWRGNRRLFVERPFWVDETDKINIQGIVTDLQANLIAMIQIFSGDSYDSPASDKNEIRSGMRDLAISCGCTAKPEVLDKIMDAAEELGCLPNWSKLEGFAYTMEQELLRLPLRCPRTETTTTRLPRPALEDRARINVHDYLVICYPKLKQQKSLLIYLGRSILQRRATVLKRLEQDDKTLASVVALMSTKRPEVEGQDFDVQKRICPYCGQRFVIEDGATAWRRHILTHTPAYFCCSQPCSKKGMWSIGEVEDHELSAHGSRLCWDDTSIVNGPAMRFDCKFCNFEVTSRFYKKEAPNQHVVFYDHVAKHLASVAVACLPVISYWPGSKHPNQELTPESAALERHRMAMHGLVETTLTEEREPVEHMPSPEDSECSSDESISSSLQSSIGPRTTVTSISTQSRTSQQRDSTSVQSSPSPRLRATTTSISTSSPNSLAIRARRGPHVVFGEQSKPTAGQAARPASFISSLETKNEDRFELVPKRFKFVRRLLGFINE